MEALGEVLCAEATASNPAAITPNNFMMSMSRINFLLSAMVQFIVERARWRHHRKFQRLPSLDQHGQLSLPIKSQIVDENWHFATLKPCLAFDIHQPRSAVGRKRRMVWVICGIYLRFMTTLIFDYAGLKRWSGKGQGLKFILGLRSL